MWLEYNDGAKQLAVTKRGGMANTAMTGLGVRSTSIILGLERDQVC